MSDPVLDVRGLTVEYRGPAATVRACDDVSFRLGRGEILGIAGESGSGKSTLITALTRLERPPATIAAGQILYRGNDGRARDLVRATERELRPLRWTGIAVVLQSAMDALNPVTRIRAQFRDVIRTHDRQASRQVADERMAELLALVGIPAGRARDYPHQLSGGMRQRVSIALALACRPDLVVLDEPTTAVDVVMQRQIVGHLLRLRAELGFAAILVTHDLSLLMEVADRVAIMYAGKVVENGTADAVRRNPLHPYTAALRDAFPPLHEPTHTVAGIPGSPPDLRRLPPGCAFAPRCARRFGPCADEPPPSRSAGDRSVSCHLDIVATPRTRSQDKSSQEVR